MRAATYRRYGPPADVVEVREIPAPTLEGDDDVLVRVSAAVVASGDWRLTVADPFAVRLYQGLFRIKRPVLGHGIAGTVEAVGPNVERLRAGDRVFGESSDGGGFAELARMRADRLALVPDGIDFDVAAATPVAGFTALQALRDKGAVRPGARVLVVGAGGAVGSTAVALAKHFGAHVTAVDGASKREYALARGADVFVDRRERDVFDGAQTWDVIVDMIGSAPIRASRRALTAEGRYVAVSGPLRRTLTLSLFGGPRMFGMIANPNAADLELLRGWLAGGTLAPVIETHVSLERTAEALQSIGDGGRTGFVVVRP